MDKETVFSIAEDYVSFLINEKKYDIKKAYLFGSYARGTALEGSDIDLAFVINNGLDAFDTRVQFMLLSRKFSLDIEPHPIREEDFNINNALAYEIMKTGLEIKLH